MADATPPAARNWQGILCPEPPPLHYEWRLLLAQARSALQEREIHYPRMIEAGRIGEDEAEQQLDIWGLIVADWFWIVDGAGEPAPRERWPDIRAQLEKSLNNLANVARETGRTDPLDETLSDQAHRLIALLWHYQVQPDQGRAHAIAGLRHAAPARNANANANADQKLAA